MRRPSTKSTIKSSSVTVTLTAVGSVSSAKVVIPCLQKLCFVFCYETRNFIQFMSRKTSILCQQFTSFHPPCLLAKAELLHPRAQPALFAPLSPNEPDA